MTNENDEKFRNLGDTRVPAILSLRDVFLMMTAVVSVMVAWGMYGARLSVVEEKMLTLKNGVIEIQQSIKEMELETRRENKEIHSDVINDLKRLDQRLRQVELRYSVLERSLDNVRMPSKYSNREMKGQ